MRRKCPVVLTSIAAVALTLFSACAPSLSQGILFVSHFDDTFAPTIGTGPSSSSGALRWEPGKFGNGVLAEEGTTNLFTNPRFANDTSDWGLAAAPGTTRVTSFPSGAPAYVTAALESTLPGDMPYVQDVAYFDVGDTVTFSMWVWADTPGSVKLISSTNAGGKTSAYHSGSSNWERLTVTEAVKNPDMDPWAAVKMGTPGTMYATAAQWEKKAYATSYADGSLGPGYSWAAAPHQSQSTRAGGDLRYPLGGNITTSKGTLSVWVKPVGWSGNDGREHLLIDAGIDTGTGFWLDKLIDNRLAFLTGGSSPAVEAGVALNWSNFAVDSWHHIVVTWEDKGPGVSPLKLYLDGSLAAQNEGGTVWDSKVGDLSLGSSILHERYANTVIDDLAVWNRILTLEEIRQIYSATSPVPTS